MKRFGNLFEKLVSWPNLVRAAKQAGNRKRSRRSVVQFEHRLEYELADLRHELIGGTYHPGPYTTFEIYEPKRRFISASPYRDRVVHHAICNVVEPILDRAMIDDSFACRTNKGTHAAVIRARQFAGRYKFVLKVDVKKFFPSIDHELLKLSLRRKLKDDRVLVLLDQVIDHSNPQEDRHVWFPGDDLFTPFDRRQGLPIGNLTSQIIANWALDEVDRYVKHDLRIKGYLRYCDDMLIFGDDSRELMRLRKLIKAKLASLRLELHENKSVVYKIPCGFPFLGYRVLKHRCLINKRNVVRFRKRMRDIGRQYANRLIDADDVQQRIMSWLGHVGHTDSQQLVHRTLDAVTFTRKRPMKPEFL